MDQALTQPTSDTRMQTIVPHLAVVLPAVRENLATIRTQLRDFLFCQLGERAGTFPIEEILLAVQEAATNVVRHAYRDRDEPGLIRLEAELSRHLMKLTVADEGPAYDPSKIPAPDFQNPTDGGYGLHLMREIMSKVTYHRRDGHNELVLEKALLGEET